MSLSINDRQRIFEEEQLRLDIREQAERKRHRTKAFITIISVLLCLGSCMAVIRIQEADDEARTVPKGSVVMLYGSGKLCGVPVDRDAFNDYWRAIGADNTDKITLLAMADRVLLVDSGTKARIISGGPEVYKISILEGKYEGRTGYVKGIEIKSHKQK
jgi:hypothetical protein